jgi:hypothetical protein
MGYRHKKLWGRNRWAVYSFNEILRIWMWRATFRYEIDASGYVNSKNSG